MSLLNWVVLYCFNTITKPKVGIKTEKLSAFAGIVARNCEHEQECVLNYAHTFFGRMATDNPKNYGNFNFISV